jgi:hypothetical protein
VGVLVYGGVGWVDKGNAPQAALNGWGRQQQQAAAVPDMWEWLWTTWCTIDAVLGHYRTLVVVSRTALGI